MATALGAIAIDAALLALPKIIDGVALYMASNPQADAEFRAMVDGYRAAQAENRELTPEELAAIEARREKMHAEIQNA